MVIVCVENPSVITVKFEWKTKLSFMETPFDHTTFRKRKEADDFINYHKYKSIGSKIKITHYIEAKDDMSNVFR